MTRREREITDKNKLRYILDTAKVIHIALSDDGMPYVIPMNYGYEMTDDGGLTLYLHCAKAGYKLDVIRKNPRVSFSMECDTQLFAGKVACQYGMIYKSICGQGRAVIVDDVAEKERSLSLLMKTQTGEDFSFNEKMASIVTVIRIDVSEYTGKERPIPAALEK
ncbi:pyridoxamine 5'-phosphate oxidase family protein [Candidatus Weimeria sp. HCP3S3_B5]|uniref:pyridoxamine 5'-phosphate oxidase family protein n=1 Tax=Candidatus Weimeria sp. HCP3S3_B5 TaxID=3438871 RepID=UPI003F898F24